MESKTVQQTVLDSKTLQQLEEKLQELICENFNKLNFSTILKEYSIPEGKGLKIHIQCKIEEISIPDNNTTGSQQAQEFLGTIPGKHLKRMFCCTDEFGSCVPCPK